MYSKCFSFKKFKFSVVFQMRFSIESTIGVDISFELLKCYVAEFSISISLNFVLLGVFTVEVFHSE